MSDAQKEEVDDAKVSRREALMLLQGLIYLLYYRFNYFNNTDNTVSALINTVQMRGRREKCFKDEEDDKCKCTAHFFENSDD